MKITKRFNRLNLEATVTFDVSNGAEGEPVFSLTWGEKSFVAGEATVRHLMGYALQSLQDSYAGKTDAASAFADQWKKLAEGAFRSGSGVEPEVRAILLETLRKLGTKDALRILKTKEYKSRMEELDKWASDPANAKIVEAARNLAKERLEREAKEAAELAALLSV